MPLYKSTTNALLHHGLLYKRLKILYKHEPVFDLAVLELPIWCRPNSKNLQLDDGTDDGTDDGQWH